MVFKPNISASLKYFNLKGTCTLNELKTAYQAKVKLLHPDVSKSPNAQAEFVECQDRYEQVAKYIKTAGRSEWMSPDTPSHEATDDGMDYDAAGASRVYREQEEYFKRYRERTASQNEEFMRFYHSQQRAQSAKPRYDTPFATRGGSIIDTANIIIMALFGAYIIDVVFFRHKRYERDRAQAIENRMQAYHDTTSASSGSSDRHQPIGGTKPASTNTQIVTERASPLHVMAQKGQIDNSLVCKRLLVNMHSVKDRRGRTPMHYAAMAGQLNSIDKLLSAGAMPDVLDIFGRDPVSYAIENGFPECAVLLRKAIDFYDDKYMRQHPNERRARPRNDSSYRYQQESNRNEDSANSVGPPSDSHTQPVQPSNMLDPFGPTPENMRRSPQNQTTHQNAPTTQNTTLPNLPIVTVAPADL